MIKTLAVSVAVLAVLGGSALADPAMGNWEGTIQVEGVGEVALTAEIIGTSRDTYRVDLHAAHAGQPLADTQLSGVKREASAVFVGALDLSVDKSKAYRVVAAALDDAMEGSLAPVAPNAGGIILFTMKRVHKTPPTLGAQPPKGATVLLNGKDLDEWNLVPGNLVEGALRIGGSSFVSKREFGDHKLHLEFCTPYMPDQREQGRGNSGVYVQGRYEIQVLDSYGDPPADNRCGGIYSISTPAAEADLPPGEWQTYDIEFRAPKFDASGNKTENARITVLHNGIVIHDNITLDHTTPGGVSSVEAEKGPLMLQEHGNPVQYRNIWVAPLD